MTLFGPDLASYQTGLNLAALTDAAFVVAKCTEGVTYADPPYAGWVAQARQVGKPLIWYHFLNDADSAQAQAANTAGHVVDPALPGMVDIETEGASRPTLAQTCAYIDACRAAGLRVKLAYLPMWYWQQVLGSPDLSPLTERGVALISSAFPGETGTGPAQYQAAGGDQGKGWAAYGGVTPLLWQFTDTALEGGMHVDYNACRGTAAELAAFLAEPVLAPGSPTRPAPPVPPPPRLLSQGSTGADVLAAQRELINHGYSLAADGDFGPRTATRVRQFQHDHGLAADGIIGAATRAALAKTPVTVPFPGLAKVAPGASGPSVKVLQQGLIRCGFPPVGGADGVYGGHTSAQVGAFQAARGLIEDRVVGPVTWGEVTTI